MEKSVRQHYSKLRKYAGNRERNSNLPKEKYEQYDNLWVSKINAIILGVGAVAALKRIQIMI